jgi:signal peptidase II
MAEGMEIKLLPVFSITHVKNTGVAFGLFQHQNAILAGLGCVIVYILFLVSPKIRREDPFNGIVLAALIGGALGNITDRIFFGRVTDFLDFHIGSHYWPVFNVADSAICIGTLLLIGQNLFRKAKTA